MKKFLKDLFSLNKNGTQKLWTLVILLLGIIGALISRIWMAPDNWVEELAEKKIENQTGIKIDLSPFSGED